MVEGGDGGASGEFWCTVVDLRRRLLADDILGIWTEEAFEGNMDRR